MKKINIILVLGLISIGTFGQTNVVTEPNKMNIVFAGLENPLSIAVSDIPPENIYLTTNKGILKGMNGNYVLWLPFEEQGNVDIKIYDNTDFGMKNISAKTFRIKEVPKPQALFGSKDGGDINIDEVKLVNFITVSLKDFAYEGIKFKVTKFRFVYAGKKKTTVYDGTGSEITAQMKETYKTAKTGDIMIITNIYASFPGSSDFKLPGAITLTIKTGKGK